MNITIKKLHDEKGTAYIRCLQEIVKEHNPYAFLTLHDCHEEHIKDWIHEQSHRFQHETFWILMNEQVVGIATIKKELSHPLFTDSGHIGICIRPFLREKGYGTRAMYKLIEKSRAQFKIQDILLCCTYDNIASRKLCERVGGIIKHEDSFVHYWISEHVEYIQDI